MGKAIQSGQRIQQLAKFIASNKQRRRRPAQSRPCFNTRPILYPVNTEPRSDCQRQLKLEARHMEAAENSEQRRRMPLMEVVTDCVDRWFHYTLKEAKAGDIAMQVLVGQMCYSGYGVLRDAQKQGRLQKIGGIWYGL